MLLGGELPDRLSVYRGGDIWRIGSIYDFSNLMIYVNTQLPCTATLVSGAGDDDNNLVNIITNNYYKASRPFVLRFLWSSIPSNKSIIKIRVRVKDSLNNIIEKPFIINIIDKNISIACSSPTVSNTISEAFTLFLKNNSNNTYVDPILANWYLVSGDGDTDNYRFSITNNTRQKACALRITDFSNLSNGQVLSIRARCVLTKNGDIETSNIIENNINLTVDTSITSINLPYKNSSIIFPVISFDTGSTASINLYIPTTYNVSSNLYFSTQIKVNNNSWKWLCDINYNTISSYYFQIGLSTVSYQSKLIPSIFYPLQDDILISPCDQVQFRAVWSYGAFWRPNPVFGEWMYSPTYTLLPHMGRSQIECGTPVINRPVYNLFISSDTWKLYYD